MNAETRNENVSLSIQLLQPELLLKSTLIEILRSRCVTGELSSWDKEKLIDLYRRVVLPLPQREFSSKWHRHPQMSSSKCKITGPESKEESKSYRIGFNGLSPVKASSISSPIGEGKKDRLKPPPDSTSKMAHKKLKVSSDNQTDGSSNSPTSASRKPPPAKVSLKRPSLQAKESESKPSKITCTSSTNVTDVKKERAKITWP